MLYTLTRGALAGVPCRIVSAGPIVRTLGEPDQIVTIAYDDAQELGGARISRIDVCRSQLAAYRPATVEHFSA